MRFSSLNLFTETVIKHTNKQHGTPIDNMAKHIKKMMPTNRQYNTLIDNMTHQKTTWHTNRQHDTLIDNMTH